MPTAVVTTVVPFDTTGLPPGATFGVATVVGGTATTAGPTGSTVGTSTDRPLADDVVLPMAGPLKVGQSFGPRYHIIKLLGVGGMGAVYQAWDSELSVAVALKVIRSRSHRVLPDQEKRFKTELLLARSVTHKNVVRIHDLGEIDATKYITMSYVQGADLATLLRRHGKFPIARSLRLARQIAAGLEAAHEAGVVHRDLKPANVMIGADDLALIMDFGISASTADAAAGGIVGTLEYMAPEQGAGATVDGRADIYAFGLILYELLLGPRRSSATTAQERIAAMRERTLRGLPPIRSTEPSIPEPLAAIVDRCLSVSPSQRFQTTTELTAALSRLDDAGELIPIPPRISRRMGAAAAMVIALLAGATYAVGRWTVGAPVKHPIVSALIADSENRSGDAAFDGPIGAQALATALDGAPFVSLYPSDQARAAAAEITDTHDRRLTASSSRLIARRDAVKVLIESSIERNGTGYRVSARIVDPITDSTLGSATASAADRVAVLRAFQSLAGKLRVALGESKSEMEKFAAAETFTAGSLDAMQAFQRAQDLANTGKVAEAASAYQDAIRFDPQLGRAYSGLAIIYRNLGQMDRAEATFKEALKHVDRMTEREKYRMLGAYYFSISRNYPKAIETYEQLVAKYPGDQAALSNLAFAYTMERNFARAEELSRQLVQLYPKYLIGRNNYAAYAVYAGDFDEAIAQGREVFKQNPTYQFGFLPLALAQLSKGDAKAGLDTYARLETLSPFGASLAHLGLADYALYQGRFRDAAAMLRSSVTADEKARDTAAAAAKYIALAEAELALGRTDAAVAAARRAAALGSEEVTLFPAATVFVSAGKEEEARAIADVLGGRLENQPRSYARLIDALIYRAHHRLPDAIDDVKEAQKRHDSWWSRYLLGVFYEDLAQPRHAEALAELELAIKRRGEAADAFIADTPTLRYVPPAYYWLARAQEGMEATAAARKSYDQYLAIRGESADDPLAADAKRRLGR